MEKRFLLILFPAILILGIVFFTIKAEIAKAYSVCRNEMLLVEGYGPWTYKDTDFGMYPSEFPKPVIDFVFSDGTNYATCSTYRDLIGWQKNGNIWQTMASCLNCPLGKFGVSP